MNSTLTPRRQAAVRMISSKMTNKTMVKALKPILETPCGPLHMRPKATLLKLVYLDFIKYLFRRTLGPRQKGKKLRMSG